MWWICICRADTKLHCSDWVDRRENLKWRHDNDLLQTSAAGCCYHPEDKQRRCLHLGCWLRMRQRQHQHKIRLRCAHEPAESHVSSWASACTRPACLCRAAQMGVWGDGCCQLTDQAVGRWSHCYSPHKHVGHVRHVPRRHTRGGYCVLMLASGNMDRGTGSSMRTEGR